MNIYLDTEFIDDGNTCSLVSMALVKENGENYYAVSSEFEAAKASSWVRENVLAQLEPAHTHKPLALIRQEMIEFIGYQIPQIWAYFATFDWLMLLRMYGGVEKLPYNFPVYCHELRQEIDRLKIPEEKFPSKTKAHHALADALWARQLHQLTQNF